jgi:hypothetical protein
MSTDMTPNQSTVQTEQNVSAIRHRNTECSRLGTTRFQSITTTDDISSLDVSYTTTTITDKGLPIPVTSAVQRVHAEHSIQVDTQIVKPAT